MSSSTLRIADTSPVRTRVTRIRESSLLADGLFKVVASRTGRVALILLALLIIMAFVAPVALGLDALEQHRGQRLQSPSWEHWFGTDEASRDLFARVAHGLRVSFLVACGAVFIGATLGSTIGYVAGYFGSFVDAVVMRFIDAMLAFPNLIMALVILVVLGSGMDKVALAIGLVNVPIFARLARAGMIQQLQRDYVLAAHSIGVAPFRLVTRHVVVNTMPPLVVQAAIAMAFAVLIEAGISYLGLGVRPPTPSLGNLMSVGRDYMLTAGVYYVVIPALILAGMMFAFNLLADTLNDAFDPRRRR